MAFLERAPLSQLGWHGINPDLDAISDDLGWSTINLELYDAGADYQPTFENGKCSVYTAMPTEKELHENMRPTRRRTFYHIGDSIERCLFSPGEISFPDIISSLLALIGSKSLLLAQSVNIDYKPHPQDCGDNSENVLGCFVQWASLVVLNDSVIQDSISRDLPYDLLSRHIIGHEIWHMYAGPFHAGYYKSLARPTL